MAAAGQKQHHVRQEICTTRAKYREGRDLKAVKVYTISSESRYLLVQGLPSLGVEQELVKMAALYGTVEEYRLLQDYPRDDYTTVMWIKYAKTQAARIARRKLDDQSFYGGVLHVCYAPEYEGLEDTRNKLSERRRVVAARIKKIDRESGEKLLTTTSQASSEEWAYRPGSVQGSRPPHNHSDPPHINPNPPLHPTSLSSECSTSQNSDITMGEGQRLSHGTLNHPASSFPHHPPANPLHPPHPPSHPPSNHNIPASDPNQNKYREYKGSSLDSKPQPDAGVKQRVRVGGQVEEVVVKQYTQIRAPRFVPRQLLGKARTLDPRHLKAKAGVQRAEWAADQSLHKDRKSEKEKDDINARLRAEAFVLRSVAGPTLPPDVRDDVPKLSLTSVTGDTSLDTTVHNIRKRVQEFASIAPPPQLRKKRKLETPADDINK